LGYLAGVCNSIKRPLRRTLVLNNNIEQMKREIKFRVWDEKLLVMFTQEKELEIKNLWKIPAANGGELNYPDGVLMQFTGLKDNNGKEIYEGDIITFNFRTRGDNFSHTGKVFFDEFMWCVETIEEEIFSINRIHNVEVIGNIYEHPYLLHNVQNVQVSDTTKAD
jgi:uncharacterized phage protein (TIGR01671 family)